MSEANKTRPNVDQRCYDLAERFMGDYQLDKPGEGDSHHDMIWDLADTIQRAIDDWIEDELERERIKEIR